MNLSGAFFLSQAVLGHMVERGSGRIINVSSIIGEIGNIGQANYAASKSVLFGLRTTNPSSARRWACSSHIWKNSPRTASGSTVKSMWLRATFRTETGRLAGVPEKVLAQDQDANRLRRLRCPPRGGGTHGGIFLAADDLQVSPVKCGASNAAWTCSPCQIGKRSRYVGAGRVVQRAVFPAAHPRRGAEGAGPLPDPARPVLPPGGGSGGRRGEPGVGLSRQRAVVGQRAVHRLRGGAG